MTLRVLDEKNVAREVAGDSEGGLKVVSDFARPLGVVTPEGRSLDVQDKQGIAQTQRIAGSVSITNASATTALPERNGEYIFFATGNTAYAMTAHDTDPTVTTAAGGFAFVIPEGVPIRIRVDGDRIAIKAAVTAGTLAILHIPRV